MIQNQDIAPLRADRARRRFMIVCAVTIVGQTLGSVAQRASSPEIAAQPIFFTALLAVIAAVGLVLAGIGWRLLAVMRLTLLGAGLSVVGILWVHGGLASFHASALMVLPAVAALVLGSRDAVFFFLFCLGSVIFLYAAADYLPEYYLDGSAHVSATFRSLFITVLLVMASMYALVRDAERNEIQLREALTLQKTAARTDTLTGLSNRAAVQAWAPKAETGETPYCLFLVDLDGFKAINDAFGHAAGDAVLIEIAERLRHIVPEDGLLARLGGDEFLVALPQDHPATAGLGQRIATELHAVRANGLSRCEVTASVGSAAMPRDGADVSDVMKKADMALYAAKSLGKATHVGFEPRSFTDVVDLRQARRTRRASSRRAHLAKPPD